MKQVRYATNITQVWTFPALLVALCGLALVLSLSPGGSVVESIVHAQAGEPSTEPLDEQTYYAIGRLRSEIGLTHRDFCAIGCDAESTQAVLERLVQWYEANRAELHRARNELLAARRSLREAAAISNGLGDQDLRSHHEAIARARASLARVHASVSSRVTAGLSPDQLQRYANSRENQGVHGTLRYLPGLSDTQRRDVMQAQESRMQAESVIEAARLSSSQAQVLAAIRSEMAARSQAVANGEEAALPIPDAIREQDAGLADTNSAE